MGDVQMATEYEVAERALSLWIECQVILDPEEIAELVDRPVAWVEYVISTDRVDGDELLYLLEADL